MITPPNNLKKTMRRRYILQQLVMMSSPREIGGVSIGRSGGDGGERSWSGGRGGMRYRKICKTFLGNTIHVEDILKNGPMVSRISLSNV